MILTIDARSLTKPISGIGRVLSNFISSKRIASSGISYSLACPKALHKDFEQFENESRVCPSSYLKWYGYQLGSISQKLGADILWGCGHRLPFYSSHKLQSVLTIHDLVWKKHPKTMATKGLLAERLLFGHAVKVSDFIMCVSHSTANDLIEFFPTAEKKITVIYPGVTKATKKPTKPEKPFMLFVGTIEPRKNLYTLLRAYSALSMSIRENIDLVIAGRQGWGDKNLQSFIDHLGITRRIKYIPSPNQTILNSLYAQCQFLVLPSLYEGFGLPIAEVMQYGKPVVTSNLSSMPEITGDAGLIVDTKNVGELKGAIEELADNTKLLNELGKKALIRSELFNQEKSALNVINYFKSL